MYGFARDLPWCFNSQGQEMSLVQKQERRWSKAFKMISSKSWTQAPCLRQAMHSWCSSIEFDLRIHFSILVTGHWSVLNFFCAADPTRYSRRDYHTVRYLNTLVIQVVIYNAKFFCGALYNSKNMPAHPCDTSTDGLREWTEYPYVEESKIQANFNLPVCCEKN